MWMCCGEHRPARPVFLGCPLPYTLKHTSRTQSCCLLAEPVVWRPCLCPVSTESTAVAMPSAFTYMGFDDPNFGPHACIANTVGHQMWTLLKPLPQSLNSKMRGYGTHKRMCHLSGIRTCPLYPELAISQLGGLDSKSQPPSSASAPMWNWHKGAAHVLWTQGQASHPLHHLSRSESLKYFKSSYARQYFGVYLPKI